MIPPVRRTGLVCSKHMCICPIVHAVAKVRVRKDRIKLRFSNAQTAIQPGSYSKFLLLSNDKSDLILSGYTIGRIEVQNIS